MAWLSPEDSQALPAKSRTLGQEPQFRIMRECADDGFYGLLEQDAL
jgi:hypothetical protein